MDVQEKEKRLKKKLFRNFLKEACLPNGKCPDCHADQYYFEKYDADCCFHCDAWLNEDCDDPECYFCTQRPDRPSEALALQMMEADDRGIAIKDVGRNFKIGKKLRDPEKEKRLNRKSGSLSNKSEREAEKKLSRIKN